MRKSVAVLDIGSSAITVIVGERGVNNSFSLKARAERAYEGFSEGQFFSEESLEIAIKETVEEVNENLTKPIKEIYVGVPGAFVRLENKKYRISFGKVKKIRQKDVDELFNEGQALIETEGYEVIGRSETFFALDDSRRVANPIGVVSSTIGGAITYVLCEVGFVSILRQILAKVQINSVNFVYQGQAIGTYLLSYTEREIPALIMDVGYITTDITVHMGNGILAKTTEDFGGGFLTFVLVKEFGLDPESAEILKRDINLSYSRKMDSVYKVVTQDGLREFSVETVNEKIIECIDGFIGTVNDFSDDNLQVLGESPTIYLTGGGLSYLRGIKSHLLARFGETVEILAPTVPFYSKAGESSKFALLDYALKDKANKIKIFHF